MEGTRLMTPNWAQTTRRLGPGMFLFFTLTYMSIIDSSTTPRLHATTPWLHATTEVIGLRTVYLLEELAGGCVCQYMIRYVFYTFIFHQTDMVYLLDELETIKEITRLVDENTYERVCQ
jgi:hypothetical protein